MMFKWNFGSWFGAQFGSTLWILITSVLSAVRDFETGALVFAMFLIPNIVGSILWIRRERLSCYVAFQVLISLIGVCSLLAVYILDRTNHWLSIQANGTVAAPWGYGIIILVVSLVMVIMYSRHGRSTN